MNRIITISLTLRTGKVWTILLYLTVGIMPQGRGETWEWQFRTEHCTKETQKIWSLWGDWVKEVCLALKRSERQLHLPEILRDWWKSYFKSVVPTVSSYLLQLENKTWEKKSLNISSDLFHQDSQSGKLWRTHHSIQSYLNQLKIHKW